MTRVVLLPRARKRLQATRRTAILYVEARRADWVDVLALPDGSIATAEAASCAVVDALVASWRASHAPILRGQALAGPRIPDDTVADALPEMVQDWFGDVAAAFARADVPPELPAGYSAELWGEVSAPAPVVDAAHDAALEALRAHFGATGEVVHPRVVAKKVLTVLEASGMTYEEIVTAVVDDRFAEVQIRRPSDVTAAALASLRSPHERYEATAKARTEARTAQARLERETFAEFVTAMQDGAPEDVINEAMLTAAAAVNDDEAFAAPRSPLRPEHPTGHSERLADLRREQEVRLAGTSAAMASASTIHETPEPTVGDEADADDPSILDSGLLVEDPPSWADADDDHVPDVLADVPTVVPAPIAPAPAPTPAAAAAAAPAPAAAPALTLVPSTAVARLGYHAFKAREAFVKANRPIVIRLAVARGVDVVTGGELIWDARNAWIDARTDPRRVRSRRRERSRLRCRGSSTS
jgi:hypothetical protein